MLDNRDSSTRKRTPGGIRTHNQSILSRPPLPDWATGAKYSLFSLCSSLIGGYKSNITILFWRMSNYNILCAPGEI